ncbi:endonuclease domain-containing protein [Noviherbaspirillum galbum]|uniref:Endonuclease domain-containing protein n=1 Tax=Noviherbaspirillum galbum TaxID=2709383 RepID=A0A6B3STY7_9BURK|nr:DUF559 domain-containing protein [Noviherbaspirillum galbum]NEX64263.1 endonuclease domain-containing protein [Noviherbaspirillum galbum]
MHGQTNAKLTTAARQLRRTMTDAERKLWHLIRGEQLGVKFRRQHPFRNFILDFVCLEQRIVIEVDGSQHAENRLYDDARSIALEQAGFHTLRFWNNEVLSQPDAVLQAIWNALNPRTFPPGEKVKEISRS